MAKSKYGTLVVYQDVNEVIICRLEDEKQMVKEYFTEGGRVLEEYDKTEINDAVPVCSKVLLF